MPEAQPGQEQRTDSAPITREEMIEMFGSEMPIEAVNLVWNSDGEKTCGELRAELRAIAAARPTADLGEDGELAKSIEQNIAWQTGAVFKGNRQSVDYLEVARAVLSRSGL